MKKSVLFKRYLCSLLLAMISCCMLVGATFAWFTDSVSNTGNKIQAGNLDIGLYQKVDNDYILIENDSDPLFDYDKWEPGYSIDKILKVSNDGNLALKYKLDVKTKTQAEILIN